MASSTQKPSSSSSTSIRQYNFDVLRVFVKEFITIQDDLLNQEFLLRVYYNSTKSILQKDIKNITFKHIFYFK